MLVLTRKRGEGIEIGDIEVIVTKISGGLVKLGIRAPGYGVLRAELGLATFHGPDTDGLLVLSRKLNDMISIRGDITVKVVELRRNRVKIGIEAPASVPVRRAA